MEGSTPATATSSEPAPVAATEAGAIPESPQSPATRRMRWALPAAVVVVVVVVIAAVALSGILAPKGNGTGTAPIGPALDYRAAITLAAASGQSAPGHPWTITAAEGIGLPSGVSQANAASIVGNGCTFTPVAGGPGTIAFPGTPANATSGAFSTWVFFAKNASQAAVLLIEVSDSAAVPLGTVTGPGCAGTFTGLSEVTNSSVENSTTIALTFDQAGGASFRASHDVATQLYILFGGSGSTGGNPVWDLSYSTCGIFSSGGSGTEYTGLYYAATGNPLSGPMTQSQSC